MFVLGSPSTAITGTPSPPPRTPLHLSPKVEALREKEEEHSKALAAMRAEHDRALCMRPRSKTLGPADGLRAKLPPGAEEVETADIATSPSR